MMDLEVQKTLKTFWHIPSYHVLCFNSRELNQDQSRFVVH